MKVSILMLLLLVVFVSTASPQCGEPGNEPCDKYYFVLEQEPDWCTYANGDGVYLAFDNGALQPTRWYVVQDGDFHTPPPTGFQDFRWWVCINCSSGCGYYF